ncbi:MAG: dephospho-CoA kinase, partial [Bacteroidota bacterium]
ETGGDYTGANPTGTATLNRAFLAQQVFNNPAALADLNAIVHPAVAQHALAWHQSQTTAAYTLYEAAITFETGGDKVLDEVIVVTAPVAVRLDRVMHRDGATEQEVRARMDKQWSEEKKVARADFLVKNYANFLLMPQVVDIHSKLLGSARRPTTA